MKIPTRTYIYNGISGTRKEKLSICRYSQPKHSAVMSNDTRELLICSQRPHLGSALALGRPLWTNLEFPYQNLSSLGSCEYLAIANTERQNGTLVFNFVPEEQFVPSSLFQLLAYLHQNYQYPLANQVPRAWPIYRFLGQEREVDEVPSREIIV